MYILYIIINYNKNRIDQSNLLKILKLDNYNVGCYYVLFFFLSKGILKELYNTPYLIEILEFSIKYQILGFMILFKKATFFGFLNCF